MENEKVAIEAIAEEGARAYSKTVWTETTPITADKLNKMENGIADVSMDIAKCLPLTGGTLTGNLTCNQYLNINAWPGYGTGQAKLWYDATTANNKALRMDNVDNLTLSKGNVYHPGNKPTAADIGAMSSNAPTFQGNMIQVGPGGRDWIYHINADAGTLHMAPHNNGTNDWDSQIMFDRSGVMYCNGRKKVPTMADQHAAHYMFRYGSGLGGANGYITFSY